MKGRVCGGPPGGVGGGVCVGGGFGSSLASGSSAGALLVKALGVLLPFNLQYFIRLAALCCYPAINIRRCFRIYGLISL